MESMIIQIKEEKAENISSLINSARENFKENKLEKGIGLLKEAQKELGKKFLLKTRGNFLAGIDSEI